MWHVHFPRTDIFAPLKCVYIHCRTKHTLMNLRATVTTGNLLSAVVKACEARCRNEMLHARTNSLRHAAIMRAAALNTKVPPWSRYCCFPTKPAYFCHSFLLVGVQWTARLTQHCKRTLLLHSLLAYLKTPGPDQPYNYCLIGLHTRCSSQTPHLAGNFVSFFNLTALCSVLSTRPVVHTHTQALC